MAARISALIITVAVISVVIAFTVWRIGAVIGWNEAGSAWPMVAALVVVVLLVGWFIYITVRNKIGS